MNVTNQIAKLKRYADKLWSKAIRKRDKECLCCKKPYYEVTLAAHHWFAQKARSLRLRWDLRNGASLCYFCHMVLVHRCAVYVIMRPLFNTIITRLGLRGVELEQMEHDAKTLWDPTLKEMEQIVKELERCQ